MLKFNQNITIIIMMVLTSIIMITALPTSKKSNVNDNDNLINDDINDEFNDKNFINNRLKLLQQQPSPMTKINSSIKLNNNNHQKILINEKLFKKIKDYFYQLKPIDLLKNYQYDDYNYNNNNNDDYYYLNDGYINRKRSCLINAGLSNNCDFRDYISASNSRRLWESQTSPGKRSISSSSSNSYSNDDDDDDQLLRQLLLRPTKLLLLLLEQQQIKNPSSSSSSRIINNELIKNLIEITNGKNNQQQQQQQQIIKRMNCISGLPGGDCENSFLGGESLGQDFFRPGGRNPGRRRRQV